MQTIIVPKPKDKSLTSQLVSLYNTFKGPLHDEQVTFDLSEVPWVCPALLLPISAYINSTSSEYSVNTNGNTAAYLETIKFPKGVDSVSVFEAQTQEHKTFIPISVLKKQMGVERERLESMFGKMVSKVIEAATGTQNAIYYPISELVTNIFEHSKKEEGYIFGQWYPTKGYLDICIVDRGRGLAQSYKDEKDQILSDADAIGAVMNGQSTKANKERGYGIRTSKQVVCKGLKGEFMLVSGSAALLTTETEERLIALPEFSWQGVIIAYRIPKPEHPVDISPYLE